MKIVVIGGAGLVGSSVVEILAAQDHDVVAASRRSGVDVITGAGLPGVLAGADVVIDVVNAPAYEAEVAGPFFTTSTLNLMAAEATAGVGHHVALSIVGSERLTGNGYFGAKYAQEQMVQAAGVPYTLLRATQFFEFLGRIASEATQGDEVRLSPARIQPIAADDVAIALSKLALFQPQNAMVELAGPEVHRVDDIVRSYLAATGDRRRVVADPAALYFGTVLTDETLMAGAMPRFGNTDFEAWLRRWVRDHPPAMGHDKAVLDAS
jgi:uncharacterized protein YbjT (DUF2867 family)